MEKEKINRIERVRTFVDYGKENYYNDNFAVRTYESEKTLTDILKDYRTEKENIIIFENEKELQLENVSTFELLELVSKIVKEVNVERYHDLSDKDNATLKITKLEITL